jgi:adenosylcobyric acid synthase
LDIQTTMTPDKALTRVTATHLASGQTVEGYEIHIGRSDGADRTRPFAQVNGADEGAISADGRVMGSYLHGLFAADDFRRAYLAGLGITGGNGPGYEAGVEAALDALAAHVEAHLDVAGLLALAR